MAQVCELTGKRPLMGNHVSHANNKTRRRFLPNLVAATLASETLGRSVRFKISTNALKTIDKKGGLDAFLMDARDNALSDRARRLRKEILKAKNPA